MKQKNKATFSLVFPFFFAVFRKLFFFFVLLTVVLNDFEFTAFVRSPVG